MVMKSQAVHLQSVTKPMISALPDNMDSLGNCSLLAAKCKDSAFLHMKNASEMTNVWGDGFVYPDLNIKQ